MSRFVLYLGIVTALSVFAILLLVPPKNPELPAIEPFTNSGTSEPIRVDFQDTSLDWDISSVHTQSSKHLTALTETLGSGICVFDFNQDGWLDIFFIGGSGHSRYYGKKSWWNSQGGNRLLLNIEGRRFEDVTEQSGLGKRIWGMG